MKDKRVQSPRKCLICNIARFGDLLQMSPTLVGLKSEHPENFVTLVTSTSFGEVTKILPKVDKILLLDLDWTIKKLSHDLTSFAEVYNKASDIIDELISDNYTFGANLSSNAASSLLLKIINLPEQRGWIADDAGYRLLNSRWTRVLCAFLSGHTRHLNSFNVVDYFRLIAEVTRAPKHLVIERQSECNEAARRLLQNFSFDPSMPFLVVHTGVSQMKRSWRLEYFAKFIDHFVEESGWNVILTGSGMEKIMNQVLVKELKNKHKVLDLSDKTNIEELTGVISLAKGLLTGDTGPLHLAAATNTKSISLFVASGWPYETGPYREGNLVIRPVIECGPCSPNGVCSTVECHDLIDWRSLVALSKSFFLGEEFITEAKNGFPDCFVYLTAVDDFGFFDLIQINNTFDRYKELRRLYRQLILADFESIEQIPVSEDFCDKDAYTLCALARQGKEITSKLLESLKEKQSKAFLESLTNQLEQLDEKIAEIANLSQSVSLLAHLYLYEKEAIYGDVLELGIQTLENYRDLETRVLQLNWLVNSLTRQSSLQIIS